MIVEYHVYIIIIMIVKAYSATIRLRYYTILYKIIIIIGMVSYHIVLYKMFLSILGNQLLHVHFDNHIVRISL